MGNRIAESRPVVSSITTFNSAVNETHKINVQKVHAENLKQISNQEPEDQNPLPADKAKAMTESINRFMETTNTNLRFQFHEDLKEYYVTIVDSNTNELVKEIPSKKLMDIYAAMRDFLGLMVDHKI